MKKPLADYREKIENEKAFVGIKPYSNTIIMLNLQMIAAHYGKASANKTIRDLGLLSLGWRQQR